MSYSIVAALLALTVASANAKLDQYCSICSDHTLCKYQAPGPACEDIGEGGISDYDKNLILDLHNWYRRLIANGYESRGVGGPQPSGSNLMKLTWDDELARVAQQWADQCLFQHDTCRDVSRWKVGQNLYWSWKIPIEKETNWTAAIESWYEEVTKFNPKDVQSFRFDPAVGHYTQLVWHDTSLVGCGRRNYGPNKLYVCNYGPTGNWINDPLYAIGAACSQCPEGTTCSDGLCDGTPKVSSYVPEDRTSYSGPSQLSNSKIIQSLVPPRKDAPDTYVSFAANKDRDVTANRFNLIDDSLFTEPEVTTTDIPIDLNVIDDLDVINNDEEIKKEIEDLKMRILQLAKKILEKRLSKH